MTVVLFVALLMCVLLLPAQSDSETNYELVGAENRNIIFVGRSRAGKTTLIEVLKNKTYSPEEFDIIRGTANASFDSFTIQSKNGRNLHLNIMDTPGLFERTIKKEDERTNEIILNMITKCIDMEITKINHVYFVMSIQQGLKVEDLQAFEAFTELFLGMEDKISIIISFAQTISQQEQYDHYREQFEKVPELKSIYQRIGATGDRVHFLGAAQDNDVYDMPAIKAIVHNQRVNLFRHIINQTEAYNVKNLPIYKNHLMVIKIVAKVIDECEKAKEKLKEDDIRTLKSFITHWD